MTEIERMLTKVGQPVRFTYPEGIVRVGALRIAM